MRNPRCHLLLAFALLTASTSTYAADWSQWRGPRRDGHVPGFVALKIWPKTLTRKWELTVGEGHSSPIIAGNRAYVFVRESDHEKTLCLNLTDGRVLWTDRVYAPFDSVIYPARALGKAPRSTPLYHEGKLYTIGVNGLMTCFNASNGKILWRKDFSKLHPIPMPICGASLSPLIDGKKIYVHAGHDNEGTFYALDKDTGKEIWTWKGEGPGYTSPVLVTIAGTRQLITAAHNRWIGLDPTDGKLLWSLPVRQNMFNHNSITPVIAGDMIICGGNQRPTFALRLRRNGNQWVPEKVWETRDVTLSTSSPVLSGQILYAVNEKRRGQLVCMELQDGRVLWTCPGNKGEHVSLYDTGTHLLAFTIGGDLFVYARSGKELAEVARYEVADGAMWSSPAIVSNRILVKGAEKLILWEVP